MPAPPAGEGRRCRIVGRHVPAEQAAARHRCIARSRHGGSPLPFEQRADADHQRQRPGARLPAKREGSARLRRQGASARCCGRMRSAAGQLEAHDPAGAVERLRGKPEGGSRVERGAFGALRVSRDERAAGSTGGSRRARPRGRREAGRRLARTAGAVSRKGDNVRSGGISCGIAGRVCGPAGTWDCVRALAGTRDCICAFDGAWSCACALGGADAARCTASAGSQAVSSATAESRPSPSNRCRQP